MIRRKFTARGVSIISVVPLLVALVGCSAPVNVGTRPSDTPDQISSDPTSALDPAETERATPTINSVPYDLTTQSVEYADANGNKQTITVSLGPVLAGSQTDALASAWAQVGGTGSWPCQDVRPESTGLSTNFTLASSTAGYAFGTVSVRNDTPAFPADDASYQFVGKEFSGIAMGMGFSSGAICNDLSSGGYLFHPQWRGSTWGPVPALIAVPSYISPKYPDGETSLLASPISLFSGPGTPATSFSVPLVPYRAN